MKKFFPELISKTLQGSIFTLLIGCTTFYQANGATPVAKDVTVLGEALYNSADETTTLTGGYTFDDEDLDSDQSTYTWYRSADATFDAGDTQVGTDKRYKLQNADYGQYLFFEVTPVDDQGETGTPVVSSAKAVSSTTLTDQSLEKQGGDNDTDINDKNTTDWLNTTMGNGHTLTVDNGSVLNVHGDLDLTGRNNNVIEVYNNSVLRISGAFIVENGLTINVDESSELIIESDLIAKNQADISVNGTMTVLGDMVAENNAAIDVADGGSLNVDGDFGTGNNGDVQIDGDMNVGGNMDIGQNSSITVNDTGTLTVGNDLTTSGNSTIDGTGPVYVGGQSAIPDEQINTGTLPIELLVFTVDANKGQVEINWSTLAETNNEYFTIERSVDGQHFQPIAQIDGAGNSEERIDYNYTDQSAPTGIVYYRLKQTDFNGDYEYFNIIAADNKKPLEITAYPNPAVDFLNITTDNNRKTSFKLLNMNGEVVRTQDSNGFDPQRMNVSDLPTGLYILHASGIDKEGAYKESIYIK